MKFSSFLDIHGLLTIFTVSVDRYFIFAPLIGDKNLNSGISQKVFADFLENVFLIYQVCTFAYFTPPMATLPTTSTMPTTSTIPVMPTAPFTPTSPTTSNAVLKKTKAKYHFCFQNLKLIIATNYNISKRKITLSHDVELNPGPEQDFKKSL